MHLALTVAALVAVVIAVAAVCRRLGLPAALVLVALGGVASFVPAVPEVELTAELALVGFLPPLLYAAALQTSLVDFNANRRAILLLSVGLVAFTTLGVGAVVHAVVPGVSWPAAFALGAVVAPPDAVAATAVARRIGMPRRVVTVLEGESLLNDATALVALRTAIAASGAAVSFGGVALDFLLAAGGGVAVGLLCYVVVARVRRHVTEPVLDTSVSLVTPVTAYVLAEELHASGVLAVVVAGLLLGHRAPVLQTPSSRIAERLNWQTVSFLLEHIVFLMIGLQAHSIVEQVAGTDLSGRTVVLACVATLLAVIATRLLWVFPARYLLVRPGPDPQTGRPPSWGYTLVIGWAGMRGVVTLAAAFVIPEDFPQRDLLVLVALVVTAGTLFLQGLSLPWLVRRLRLPGPDAHEDALARAALFREAGAAGSAWLSEHADEDDPFGAVAAVRERVERRDHAAWEQAVASPSVETPSDAYARLRRGMLQAERARLLELRSTGTVAHEVLDEVLVALDIEESMLDARPDRVQREDDGVVTRPQRQPKCDHLAAAPDLDPPARLECQDCVALGLRDWVHLRQCLGCGRVACCDSSPRRHATAHFQQSAHPVMRSAEPQEHWRWCFVDEVLG